MDGPQKATPGGSRADAGTESTSPDIVGHHDDGCNEFARVKALAERSGCTLHRLSGGAFLLTRWAFGKELPDLRSVAVMLNRMGCRK
jgi:hypothetical protein